jgi:hypothetical protein
LIRDGSFQCVFCKLNGANREIHELEIPALQRAVARADRAPFYTRSTITPLCALYLCAALEREAPLNTAKRPVIHMESPGAYVLEPD